MGERVVRRVPTGIVTSALAQLQAAVSPGTRVRAEGVSRGFTAFVLTHLLSARNERLVVLTPNDERAAELKEGLRFFLGDVHGRTVVHLPVPEETLYSARTVNRLSEMQRLAALFQLATSETARVLVISARALTYRTMPREALVGHARILRSGEQVAREAFCEHLNQIGYRRVPVVEDPGTYAVRGGILDVFSPLYPRPARIDLFGDEIESIRFFDSKSQRRLESVEDYAVIPCRVVSLIPNAIQRARGILRSHAADIGVPAPQVRAILAELERGLWPLGVEGWLPAFYESPGTVLDFLGDSLLWCVEDPDKVAGTIERFQEEAGERYEAATSALSVVFPAEQLLVSLDQPVDLSLETLLYEDPTDTAPKIPFHFKTHEVLARALADVRGQDQAFRPAVEQIRAWRRQGLVCVVLGGSEGHAETLRALFSSYGLRAETAEGLFALDRLDDLHRFGVEVNIFVGSLSHGFVFEPLRLSILGTDDVIPQARRAERPTTDAFAKAALESFQELEIGDRVVHVDHGIGRYEGLVKLSAGGVDGDFLKLVYRGDDVLYVPVYKLDRVQRYSGGSEAAPGLDRLGGVTWEKTRSRARRAAESMAKVLIEVQATRNARVREPYSPQDDYFEQFAAAFPYEPTPDQARAIGQVLTDLDGMRPMDRLVCGDVGYGKTEVAMRAAFRVVSDSKQVAVLVPTTVLAEQHRLTLAERFEGYPVTVAALSRFRTRREEKKILADLSSGRVDIVVGTHRLLSRDVVFRDLGLLVVDEEHRFGVRHKERIKQLKELVDVLTLTATPIPRTLHMALSGLRDMSIIATPPSERLAVRTIVSQVSDEVMREAITQELQRGGQVYLVHNRVETIHRLAEKIQKLVPQARVAIGHGQLPERELESVMLRFMAGEADILVCTTIIESGLDIPRANTMLIHRADQLGLAQMYQLRGRIGRSSQRAYCYLLVPALRKLTGLAERRVEAMQRFSELGSGFHVAAMDLELRGAGNLLGGKQSGHVRDVGLELFCELLAEAVQKIAGQEAAARPTVCEVKVALPAFLPEDYVPNVNLRLFFYKRIASARSQEELSEVFEDIADRCGRLPVEAAHLLDVTHLKIRCQQMGATSVSYSSHAFSLQFDATSPFSGAQVLTLIQRLGPRWRLTPKELIRSVAEEQWSRGLSFAQEVVGELIDVARKNGLLEAN